MAVRGLCLVYFTMVRSQTFCGKLVSETGSPHEVSTEIENVACIRQRVVYLSIVELGAVASQRGIVGDDPTECSFRIEDTPVGFGNPPRAGFDTCRNLVLKKLQLQLKLQL